MKARITSAFLTMPGRNDWTWALSLLAIFCFSAIPLWFSLNFLTLEFPDVSAWVAIRIALVALVFPAVAEETLFRVLLLPHVSEQRSLTNKGLAASISLILFVLYHPLNAALFIHSARPTFYSFSFLLLALMLGIVCTVAYLKSGSVYLSIFLHWIVVIGWLLYLGGYGRLHQI